MIREEVLIQWPCLLVQIELLLEWLMLGFISFSGSIDYEEFLAATLNSRKLENEEQLLKAFEHFDTDSSGTISRDELKQALQKYGESEENITKLLKEVDKDGDGQIDYEEFRQMMLTQ